MATELDSLSDDGIPDASEFDDGDEDDDEDNDDDDDDNYDDDDDDDDNHDDNHDDNDVITGVPRRLGFFVFCLLAP